MKNGNLYKLLFDHMLNGFAHCSVVYDADGRAIDWRYVAVNPAFEKQTGLKDATGKLASEVIPGIHISDPEILEIYASVADTLIPARFERYVEALHAWFDVTVFAHEKGTFTAVFDVVTHQKQATEKIVASEVRYRRLFEAAQDGILILDAETEKIIDVNPFMITLLNNSIDYFIGKELWELGFFKDIVANKEAFAKLLKDKYVRYENLPLETHTGHHIWVEFVSNVYEVSGKQVIQCNIRDITDRRQLEMRLTEEHKVLEDAYDQTLMGWARALELRNKETRGHSDRVVEMTIRLAKRLGIEEEELVHYRRGALLHDIGKMGIPDSILLKPGKLTEDEKAIMRLHPEMAYILLEPIGFLKESMTIPYSHHEKWDGTGYPTGKAGKDIPLAARIFSVVDVYDAMVSDRVYREGMDQTYVLEYIKSVSGTWFDPKVVIAFLLMLKENE